MKKLTTVLFAVVMIMAALTSCLSNNDSDGKMPVLFAQIGMINTNSEAKVTSATLDDGTKILFSTEAKSEWATAKDTIYRAMMYFYVDNNKIPEYQKTGIYHADLTALQQVLYFKIYSKEEAKEWIDDKDPITFVSGTRSNGYINMQLSVPMGSSTETAKHIFGVAKVEDKPGNRILRLCHNQNGIAKVYSSDVFATIPVRNLAPTSDTVSVIIPTASGDKTYKFVDVSMQKK